MDGVGRRSDLRARRSGARRGRPASGGRRRSSRASDALEAGIAVNGLHAASWPDGMRSAACALRCTPPRPAWATRPTTSTRARGAPTWPQAARWGQVLLSGVTAALVIDRLPASTALVDLGHHRLGTSAAPSACGRSRTRVFGLVPPLQSLDRFPHNLPFQLTALVGRAADGGGRPARPRAAGHADRVGRGRESRLAPPSPPVWLLPVRLGCGGLSWRPWPTPMLSVVPHSRPRSHVDGRLDRGSASPSSWRTGHRWSSSTIASTSSTPRGLRGRPAVGQPRRRRAGDEPGTTRCSR